jgi:hypothetical protein
VENGHSNNGEIKLGQLTGNTESPVNVLRRSTRLPYYKKLKYGLINGKSRDGEDTFKFNGFTLNISEHGIGMQGSKGFPPNFKIEASLFTGERTIRFEGTIKWLYHSNSEKWYMGIEITSKMNDIKDIYSIFSNTSDF